MSDVRKQSVHSGVSSMGQVLCSEETGNNRQSSAERKGGTSNRTGENRERKSGKLQ